jgi:hypothetical protein
MYVPVISSKRSFEGTELVPRLFEGNVRMHLEEMQRHAESGDDRTGKTCGYRKFCMGYDPSKFCLIEHHIVKTYEGSDDIVSRSQWSRGLRHEPSLPARTLGS